MSVIEVGRPAAAVPAPSWFNGWWNTGLRLVLLGVLAIAAVVALPSARPQSGSVDDFLGDLRSGHVSAVRYVSNGVEVRWSDGWMHWHQASLLPPLPDLPPSPDLFVVGSDNDGTSEQWLLKALDATGHQHVNYGQINNAGGAGRLTWSDQLPWHTLSAWTGAAALGAFLLMLFRKEHRFANRWAWLWLMLATSGLGSVLYLAFEPGPLWRRPSHQRPLPQRPVFLGGAGLLIAIALKPAIALLALLVSS